MRISLLYCWQSVVTSTELRFMTFLARLDFRHSFVSGLPSPRRSSGEERGLLSRTAAGNRAYFLACVAGVRREGKGERRAREAQEDPNRRLVSSVGRAPVCCAGGRGFELQTGPTLRVLKYLRRMCCLCFVIISANG